MSEEAQASSGSERAAEPPPPRSFLGPRIAAVAILAFGLFVLFGTFQISERSGYSTVGPGFFPLVIAVGLLVFGALFLLRTTVRQDRYLGEKAAAEGAATYWPTVGLVAAALLVYAFTLRPLGYIVATALFFPAVAYVLGSVGLRMLVRNLAIGTILAVIVYFGFTELLGVRLTEGLLDPLL